MYKQQLDVIDGAQTTDRASIERHLAAMQSQTLNQSAAAVTALGYIGVGSVYMLVVVLALLFPVPWDSQFTIAITAAIGLLAWAGWFWMRLHPIAPERAHFALTFLLGAMAIQTGIVLYEIAEPIHSGNQVLMLFCAAFFLSARPWFYLSIALTVGCWVPAALAGFKNEELVVDWNQWMRMLIIAAALSIAYFEARRRTVLRTSQLKLEAEAALIEAQNANTRRLSMQNMMQESQRREALGVLAGGIAHDFNNLLTVISGNLQLLRLDNHPLLNTKDMLNEMQKASDRATELTQQMLVYAGKSRPKIGSIKLGERIRSAAKLIESSNSPNVTLKLNGTSDGPRISVDSTLLDQLIINLIQNAKEACEEEGGVVRVNWYVAEMTKSELAELRFSSRPTPGHYAVIEISDNGIGMDEYTRHKMFEPFYSTKSHGNGLGLAVATGILESHMAGVSVRSQPGEGTTMSLALPIAEQQNRSAKAAGIAS